MQTDAVVRVTSTAICGSDLHLYLGSVPGMQSGDIMGHEFMGIVEEVGPEVGPWKELRAKISQALGDGSGRACLTRRLSRVRHPSPLLRNAWNAHVRYT